jgi:hypothetical protein
MYRYEFDHTTVGDFRFSREEYELLQEALRLLRDKLMSWEKVARSHSALSSPYELELADLNQMISWGEEKLRGKSAGEIRERGLSVGSRRYIKAALVHAAWNRKKEIAAKQATWPSAVTQTLHKKLDLFQKFADKFSLEPAPILDEVRSEYTPLKNTVSAEGWDAFISHASEDKDAFVRPLAEALRSKGLRIWYDEFTLTVGDSLRRSIDRGLARSRFGIVVLSPSFFAKDWPQKELDGLVAPEVEGQKVILPVWHCVDAETIRKFSPTLADRMAVSSALGIEAVVNALITAMSGDTQKDFSSHFPTKEQKSSSISDDSAVDWKFRSF